MTTIREYTDSVHAALVLSFLKDNEIDAVLADENSSLWIEARFLVPIRLLVADDQVEQANQLLNDFDQALTFEDADAE